MKNHKQIPFADCVFDEAKMKKYLLQFVYRQIAEARDDLGEPPQKALDVYAKALCRWAIRKGATRYTHWFSPLNNCSAGKRDSMYSLDKDCAAVLKFRGKELSKGEGDASSFPSGGMRSIYEARGLTRWDVTSYPFVRENCLYIPCTFCGAGGEVLDKKTPLLYSSKALDKQAVRLLRILGENVSHIWGVVGAEQEYFLVDKALFDKRPDLVYTGRTLFGAPPSKGQEFDDHYFCPLNNRVLSFMQEVDDELWKLGVLVKTEHNEVAPCQHELAPCYTRANLASDRNQLTMEVLREVANRHGLSCLLHEKPFEHVNGSGKHNNWSLLTDGDVNLLEPGITPKENVRFLLVLAAIVKAVDDYHELLLAAISSRANDCRLGGFEAPPRVLTVFLGEQLERAIALATNKKWRYGVDVLPTLSKNTDRNRTSPFAFTGNKFEFRSVGSSASVADVNAALHVAVAESFRVFADRMERSTDVMKCAGEIVSETFAKHKRIVFSGNNYSDEWAEEAKLRGLKGCDCLDAALALTNAHNVNVLARHGVLSAKEVAARQKIMLQNYVDTIKVECSAALEMFRKSVFGGTEQYLGMLAETAKNKSALGADCGTETTATEIVTRLLKTATLRANRLQRLLDKLPTVDDKALYCRDTLCPALDKLRAPVDKLETLVPKPYRHLPSYGELLFELH